MKKLVAFCLIATAVIFAGCFENGDNIDTTNYTTITLDDTSIRTFGNETELPNTTMCNDIICVTIDSDVENIEFDLARFFENNPEYLGSDFYFTRNDVKKDNGSLVKGRAWVQIEESNSSTRLFKRLGQENNNEMDGMTKNQINALPDHQGDVRMYILSDGNHSVYIDGIETEVDFKFHGDNGKSAIMKTKIKKHVDA